MIKVNDNFRELPAVYLFTQISRILSEYKEKKDVLPLIRMDIGDISGPLAPVVVKAMHEAVKDLSDTSSFKGYGPEQGYSFLREKIVEIDYSKRGLPVFPSEIFISDGAKCDLGNLGDILSKKNKVAVMDPSYPAYVDDNVIDGRAGYLIDDGLLQYSRIVYLKCDPEKGFNPELPTEDVDIIYICSPNNPTGCALTHDELKKWVNYAKEKSCLIIYDSAYEAYIRTEGIPHSIYEIPGAKEVSIEVRSFSKSGGFTGLRCGYTVVPHELVGYYSDGGPVTLNALWSRRQTTKFNGASYVSQRAAEALYSEEGQESIKKTTESYLSNARLLRKFFDSHKWITYGGEDSPYVWVKNPYGKNSVEVFSEILKECGVSTTPGTGFGQGGKGFIRLTGFNTEENTKRAVERLQNWINKLEKDKN